VLKHFPRTLHVDHVTLKAESFLSETELKKLKHKYYDGGGLTKIERDTMFWYEPGRHGLRSEVAGLYLKNVIPAPVRDRAFAALEGLEWRPPKKKGGRPETFAGIKRQRGREVAAKEITIGNFHIAERTRSQLLRTPTPAFLQLEELLVTMNRIFKYALPQEFAAQNTPKSERERELERDKKNPNWGGIPWRFRIFLTAFSNITLLKSCPSALHRDQNGGQRKPNFSCLTSIGKGFEGGTFCLLEYGLKIPVTPGDILICQSTREWHTNIGAVDGLKYSIVTYYKPPLASLYIKDGPTAPKETPGMRFLNEYMARSQKEKAELLSRGLSKLKGNRHGR
jgi:hypothetical protein